MSILKKYIKYFLAIIFILVYIYTISRVEFQNDTLFDIKVGENYIKNGISLEDNFSIHENLEYISQHFMVSIITYLVFKCFNFLGLYLLEIILTCILSLVLYKANKLFIKSKRLRYFFIFFELTMFIPYISVRAQMYSYILFILEIIFIEYFLRHNKKVYLAFVSILPLFIMNFHAGVIPVYYIIILVYMSNLITININNRIVNDIEYKKNVKWLSIPMIIGSALIFINPFGIKNITYFLYTIFGTSQSAEFGYSNINNNTFFFLYFFILCISFIFTKSKIKIHQLLFFLGSTLMSLISIRHFSIFIIMTLTCSNFIEEIFNSIYNWFRTNKESPQKDKKLFVISCYIIFILYYIIFALGYLSYKKYDYFPSDFYPIAGVQYIKENIDKEKKIFNFYDWGTLMMFNDIKVFIDSRCDLYTPSYNNNCNVYKDHNDIISLTGNYNEILEKYNIDYVFIPLDKAIYNALINDNHYIQIYKDDLCSIFEIIK